MIICVFGFPNVEAMTEPAQNFSITRNLHSSATPQTLIQSNQDELAFECRDGKV